MAAIGIKYIGTRDNHFDKLFGTNLHFKAGQVYSIEESVAKKMLEFTDTYVQAKIPAGAKMVRAVSPELDEADTQRRNEPPMLDFTRMPDSELRDFARLHYGENLPPHALHQTLVERLVAFAHRPR